MSSTTSSAFSRYQVFVIALLATLQFTIILDFMVLSPLGVILMKDLKIQPSQFSIVVSAYAISAGISGFLAAGFADKFDRKKLLLFFYCGFVLGTFFCALAPDFHFLLLARIFTGIFGGVISSISFAIITDIFPMEKRGRVMGFVQMAFAASQVLGIPLGLYLANHINWHAPFYLIGGFAAAVGAVIVFYLQPITGHLAIKSDRNPFMHLVHTISKPDYLKGFLATVLLATGGFMLMPFGSAFSTHNMHISVDDLPVLYAITGVFSIIFGPLMGKLSDSIGKYTVFLIGTVISVVMVAIYTNLGATPLWLAITLNVILFVGISSRMISASALTTALPLPQDRGAFMSINSSIQQISGGVASWVAGLIVVQDASGTLFHYNTLGYVVIGSMCVAAGLMFMLNQLIKKNAAATAAFSKAAEKPAA